jgi:hypothetical protein
MPAFFRSTADYGFAGRETAPVLSSWNLFGQIARSAATGAPISDGAAAIQRGQAILL